MSKLGTISTVNQANLLTLAIYDDLDQKVHEESEASVIGDVISALKFQAAKYQNNLPREWNCWSDRRLLDSISI